MASPLPRSPPLDSVQPLNLLLDISVLDRLKREMRHDLEEAAVMCVSATPAGTREEARRLLTRKARELRWSVQTGRGDACETVTGTYLGVVFAQHRTGYSIQEVFTFPHSDLEFCPFPARFGVCGAWLPGPPAAADLADVIAAFERRHLATGLGEDRLVYAVAAYEAVCEFFGIY